MLKKSSRMLIPVLAAGLFAVIYWISTIEQPLIDLHAGDSFGQTSVLDGGRRPVTAYAGDEGADYMSIARQPMLDLMADRPALVNGLFAELGMRIRELIDMSRAAGAESLRPRTSSTLCPR